MSFNINIVLNITLSVDILMHISRIVVADLTLQNRFERFIKFRSILVYHSYL